MNPTSRSTRAQAEWALGGGGAGLTPDRTRRPNGRGATPALVRARGAGAVALVAVTGCGGCHGDHPYTPYTLDAGAAAEAVTAAGAEQPGPADELDAGAEAAAGAAFAIVDGGTAPGDGKTWDLEGGATVRAPAARTFEVGLPLELDGDGKQDLLVWARAPDGLRGELWLATGAAPDAPTTIAALPADLAGRGCTSAASIAQVGPHTAALRVEARCGDRARDRVWIAVVLLGPKAELRTEIVAQAGLAVAVEGGDADGDGREDLTARVTLAGRETAGAQPVAPLRFLDRPAGLSRDPTEPEASLRAAAGGLSARARRKSSAEGVVAGARALAELRRAVCDDEGAPRVTTTAGPIRCGDARSIEEATLAVVQASLTRGDPARAAAAVARRGPRRKEGEKLLEKQAPAAAAAVVHRSAAAPAGDPDAPGWSPLAFEHAGALLVRTADAVVRVDRASFAEAPAPEAAPWPLGVTFAPAAHTGAAPAGAQTLFGLEQRCDPAAVSAVVGASDEALRRRVELSLLGAVTASGWPLPAGDCKPLASVRAQVVDGGDRPLRLAVGGETVALGGPAIPTGGGERPLGAARSPDGAWAALLTPLGLVVQGPKDARLWTSPDLAGAWGCTVSNGGARAACVAGGAALVLEPR